MTLAPESITRPDRSDVTVTGTYEFKLPLYATAVARTIATMTAMSIAVHHAGCSCRSPDLDSTL
jgi:hypothetical protein